MAKPILQLGLDEERDTEFDPLLGRTVREKPDAARAPRPTRLNLDQSVFDDVDITDAAMPDGDEHGRVKATPKSRIRARSAAQSSDLAGPTATAFTEHGATLDATGHVEGDELAAAGTPYDTTEESFDAADSKPTFAPQFGTAIEVASTRESLASKPFGRLLLPLFKVGGVIEALKVGTQSEMDRQARRVHPPKRSAVAQRLALQKLAATVLGFGLFHASLFATFFSFAAPLGYPYDVVSSYRWYWTLMALASFGAWAFVRTKGMMVLSGLVVGLNLIVMMPSMGQSPKGGKDTRAIVAWANVMGAQQGLEELLRQSEKQKASLVLIGQPPKSVLMPLAGWKLLEKPDFADPTSIAVLAKSSWKSTTSPGEPTMLQHLNENLTVIGVRPQPPHGTKTNRVTREAQLNRAAIRAGDQAGPIAVLGDFSAVPWDGAMGRFRHYGNIDRVQCGGLLGTTLRQGYGLLGVTYDHVYVRDIKVTRCKLGSPLPGGHHRAIFLSVAPKAVAR
jgi:hypothetical protein